MHHRQKQTRRQTDMVASHHISVLVLMGCSRWPSLYSGVRTSAVSTAKDVVSDPLTPQAEYTVPTALDVADAV